MSIEHKGWGWHGSVDTFLGTKPEIILSELERNLHLLLGMNPSQDQKNAWADEISTIEFALKECLELEKSASTWKLIFEYELPMEGGRRPDVLILAGNTIYVLEFKTHKKILQSELDQVAAYARDIEDYHLESRDRKIVPFLVSIQDEEVALEKSNIIVTGKKHLSEYLVRLVTSGEIDLETWLNSPYEPLPKLVDAAKKLFNDQPLPHVRKALSLGIDQAVEFLNKLCQEAQLNNRRYLAFVTGVPGAGKTLVGLRLVYERSNDKERALFLSGNGPLVAVLRDALKSGIFVKDLHKVILDYGRKQKIPSEHVIVFDEAQRAWDRQRVSQKHNLKNSEPDLLIQIGERTPNWSTLVGLVGDGQEIHAGEEAGLEQWAEAVRIPNAREKWKIFCPERVLENFQGLDVEKNNLLDLTVSLRSKRAEKLNLWISNLLDGSLAQANSIAENMRKQLFPIYITRDLELAKNFISDRFMDSPDARYGLLASSHSKVLIKFGIKNDFWNSKFIKIGPWFNEGKDNPHSGGSFNLPATEFHCQGLELDMPIVCWGEDFKWTGTEWLISPKRRRDFIENPEQLLKNTYRVLLSRGREGMVIYLPQHEDLDMTEVALLAAGVRSLESEVSLKSEIAS
jgi:hypothetical protein